MKKGLRPEAALDRLEILGLNERPDEEGITTHASLIRRWSPAGLNERPDEEGITTEGVEKVLVQIAPERTP